MIRINGISILRKTRVVDENKNVLFNCKNEKSRKKDFTIRNLLAKMNTNIRVEEE